AGEKVMDLWQSGFGKTSPANGYQPPVDTEPTDPTPAPEPEPLPEPQPTPEPVPEPEPDPEPQPPVTDPGGSNPDETPVIYVNQELIIPVSSAVPAGSSKVVKEGIKTGNQKQIALTFDAGWLYDQTVPLLDILDDYYVNATFFPRALWVKDHPELARQIVTRGHIIENHSLTHGDMTKLSDAQIVNELQESQNIIRETTSSNPYLFRPPYGAYDSRLLKILAEEGFPYTVMWTVDTHDWAEEIGGQKVTADYLVNRVLNNASDNGIILMHVGGYKTLDALPRIITGLREKGYQLVTVNEMLPRPTPGKVVHTVQQGETLFSISRQYGVTVDEIILVNNLR
ncbi:MAG: polysaccharide deacetylase family protein, partial [Bacillota bacterium]|nr:polysaccharide deacetylase family protein [Bacillota bacterium]